MNTLSRRAFMGVGSAPIIDALKFTVNENSQAGTITLTIPSGLTEQECTNIQYSLNGKTWVTFENHGQGLTITTPTLIAGDSVYFRGQATLISKSSSKYSRFTTSSPTFKISASGNVMSLIGDSETLTSYAFYDLFYGCTSLTTAPELPATTLASYCYVCMFYGCTSLTTAPELPATTLASYCYDSMFSGCTSLTTAPNLPVTTLAVSCYNSMFYGCTSLTTTPELPATTLEGNCYRSMFSGCTSLTTAPNLPATTLAVSCYREMFRDCTQLNKITMLATDISASNCLYGWVQGVAATGTFIKNPAMTTLPTGTSGIPSGWIVKDLPNPYLDYSSPNTFSIIATNRTKWWEGDLEYSYDKTHWQLWTGSLLTAVQGDNNLYHIYMRGKCTKLGGLDSSCAPVFSGEHKTVSANGDIRTLMNYEDVDAVVLTSQCLAYYFYNNKHLIKAPDIPFTTTASECFSNMFYGCVNLQESPILSALTLTNFCYVRMFEGCTNLQKITMLATNISANGCLAYWVSSVGSNGTFIKNAAMTTLPTGDDGIPSGWTVEDYVG